VHAPGAVVPITGGWDTQIWRVADAHTAYALRVFRADQLATCHREAAVMRTLFEAGLPVPRVHAEGVSGDRPALLLSWCPGRTLLAQVKARPWRIWPLGVALGRMHARIHALPVPAELAGVVPAWNPRREDLAADLLARLDTPASTSLLHLDYHPLNVMVQGGQVTGVLDWANVALGDRRADLARTVTLLRLPPLPPGTPAIVGLVMRPILEAAWRNGYRQLQMVDPFVDMAPFYVWAGAMLERDLRPKLGRPGVWLQESDLARIRRWTLAWKQHNT
jgi:aminoglycoside phosphotransferase (APT) family kinase protein